MKTTGNTILITGGGSRIRRGLAEAFHALGNQVVIVGRGQKTLDATTAANPGMESLAADLSNPEGVRAFAARMAGEYPSLNVLVNNAGMMRMENLRDSPEAVADAEATIATNLLGPIRLTGALLPLLRQQTSAVVMNVTSGLAFVPMAATPTYCATKAALHSHTESLRYQLSAAAAH